MRRDIKIEIIFRYYTKESFVDALWRLIEMSISDKQKNTKKDVHDTTAIAGLLATIIDKNDALIEMYRKNIVHTIHHQEKYGDNQFGPLYYISCTAFINGGKFDLYDGPHGDFSVYNSYGLKRTAPKANRKGNFNIIIDKYNVSPECVRLVKGPIFLHNSCFTISPWSENKVLHRYLGYYLYSNQYKVYDCIGLMSNNISMNKFSHINIAYPSIECQRDIINYCDIQFEQIKKIENENAKYKAQLEAIDRSTIM